MDRTVRDQQPFKTGTSGQPPAPLNHERFEPATPGPADPPAVHPSPLPPPTTSTTATSTTATSSTPTPKERRQRLQPARVARRQVPGEAAAPALVPEPLHALPAHPAGRGRVRRHVT